MNDSRDDPESHETSSPDGNALFDATFHATPVLIAHLDPHFNFVRVNHAYASADGKMPEYFPGKNHFTLFPHSENEAIFRRVRDTGVPHTAKAKPFEYKHNPERGVTHWDWVLTPITGNGRVTGLVLVLQNVTEQIRDLEALAHSEAQLNEAQRIARVGSWELDIVRNQLKWSDEIFNIFGVDRDRFGASYAAFLDAIHPDDRSAVDAAYTDSLKNRTPYEITHRLQMPDGRIKWVTERCESFFDGDGAPLRSIGTVQDVTEAYATQARLRQTTQLLDSIVENIPSMIFMKHADDLRFALFNKAGEELTGFGREELIGRNDHDFFPAEQADFFTSNDRVVLSRPGVVDIPEETIDTRHNGRRVLHTRKIALRDENGVPRYLLGISEDITERKRAEEVLRRLNESLEQRVAARTRELDAERNFTATVLDIAGALVMVLDRDGRIVRFNRACEQLTGLRFQEAGGRPIFDLVIPEEQRAEARRVFEHLRDGSVPANHENLWVASDGSRRLIAWSNSTICDSNGNVEYVIGTGIDITERNRAEQQLLAAKQEAERANRAKSEFLSRMSHELRTPLNVILGFAQMLDEFANPPLAGADRESVREILHAGEHLLRLISEILDLTRIESGQLQVKIETLSVVTSIQEAVALAQPLADARRVTVVKEFECDDTPMVRADAVRLKQILLNLLSNAVKFNRRDGTVRVRCARSGGDRLKISISDTGPGLLPEQIQRLFVPFERLDADRHAIEGTGIGLALSRRLIELMHGTIGVDSVPGTGSTFWITVPVAIT